MNREIEEIFHGIEIALVTALCSVQPENEIYACGFWLFYCDHTVIRPPCFGYNSSYEHEDDRWSPPEWDVDIDNDVYGALEPFYQKLIDIMSGQSDDAWENLMNYQWSFYTNLCRKLNMEVDSEVSPFKEWPRKSNFVVGVFEVNESEEMYDKLAVQSLGHQKAQQLCVI